MPKSSYNLHRQISEIENLPFFNVALGYLLSLLFPHINHCYLYTNYQFDVGMSSNSFLSLSLSNEISAGNLFSKISK